MVNKDAQIIKLVSQIDSGKLSPETVRRLLERFEARFGALDMLYDVESRTDKAYYEELLSNARIGIYNKESLIKMAELRYNGTNESCKCLWPVCFALGVSIVTIVIGILAFPKKGDS